MANYWVFLNGDVQGPFSLEQLIRVRGFSRRTQVCIDDSSGKPGQWISPADLPELAHIFKTVDQINDAPPPIAKPPPKPVIPRPVPRAAPAPAPIVKPPLISTTGIVILLGVVLGAASGWHWFQVQQAKALHQEEMAAQNFIETLTLPSHSLYSNIRQCLEERRIQPRWEFEHQPSGLFNITLSWFTQAYGPVPASAVYAFEVNMQAQVVRGINTAATRLLAEGFVVPVNNKPVVKPTPSPAQRFKETLESRRSAIENGDYETVWSLFSQRKQSEMIQAGMSETGFVRLQNLTHKLEAGLTQTVLKTKSDGDSQMLALLRQSQSNHPDIFLKQLWILENKEWRLDDEEKKAVQAAAESDPIALPAAAERPASTPVSTPPAPTPAPPTTTPATASPEASSPAKETPPSDLPKTPIPIQNLPGVSN